MAFDLKFSLLENAFRLVTKHGWSDAALIAGAAELGLPPVSARALCPSGPIEIVEHAQIKWTKQLALDMPSSRLLDYSPTQRYFRLI
jgi:ubiquinone biosynthesis protein COQ9